MTNPQKNIVVFDMGVLFDEGGEVVPDAAAAMRVMYSRFTVIVVSVNDYFSAATKTLADNQLMCDHIVVRGGTEREEEHKLKAKWMESRKLPVDSILVAFEKAKGLACVWERFGVPCVHTPKDHKTASYRPGIFSRICATNFAMG